MVNLHGSCTLGRLWLVVSPALAKLNLCRHIMVRVHRPLAVAEILLCTILHTQNRTFLENLKFGIGDGSLHYYLFNWRMSSVLTPSEVGLILM